MLAVLVRGWGIGHWRRRRIARIGLRRFQQGYPLLELRVLTLQVLDLALVEANPAGELKILAAQAIYQRESLGERVRRAGRRTIWRWGARHWRIGWRGCAGGERARCAVGGAEVG